MDSRVSGARPDAAPRTPGRPLRVAWLCSGRDDDAATLLAGVVGRARRDALPLQLAALFCDRAPGEAAASDRFLELAARLELSLLTLSSAASWDKARERGLPREAWREEYHAAVAALLAPYRPELLVLAGYLLITGPAMCERFAMLNLHPALPDGPTGTWRAVVWRLLEQQADESGVLVHLATAELDRGPAISYLRFPLRGGDWDRLWAELGESLRTRSVADLAATEGAAQPLFARVRRWEVAREAPLLYETLRQVALGRLSVTRAGVTSTAGPLPLDLTALVEAELARG